LLAFHRLDANPIGRVHQSLGDFGDQGHHRINFGTSRNLRHDLPPSVSSLHKSPGVQQDYIKKALSSRLFVPAKIYY